MDNGRPSESKTHKERDNKWRNKQMEELEGEKQDTHKEKRKQKENDKKIDKER